MYAIKKNTILFKALLLFLCPIYINAVDFITITAPANGATVSGEPLAISGTSSRSDYYVRLKINSTIVGRTVTDGSGNWSFSNLNLSDGNYTLTADLISPLFEILATDANNFTVQNAHTISVTSPEEDEVIFLNPSTVQGVTSLAAGEVDLSVDGNFVTTATADANGNWQADYTLTSNGVHTLLAELVVLGLPVASASVDIDAQIPIIFPTGKTQIRVVEGDALTSGSGSGPGYTYSVSGSVVTISFVPAFSSVPAMIAIGQRSSGSSTVTLASINTTAANIAFSTGTQKIHFTASALA